MDTTTVDYSVYVISDRAAAGHRSIVDIVQAAVQGGATVIQLREKETTTREMVALGRALHQVTQAAGVSLIVNDRVDVALALAAEGVHVGQDDMPADLARQLIGPEAILGVSAETVAQARQAERDGADYLGVGDVFGTPTKPDAGVPIGIDGLAQIAVAVSIPVVGIGGITVQNAAVVIEAGAKGVSVISTVVGAADPEVAARQLAQTVSAAKR